MTASCGFVKDILLFAITDMSAEDRRELFRQEATTILASMVDMLAETTVRLVTEASSIADAATEIEKLEDARRLIGEIYRLINTQGRSLDQAEQTTMNLTA